MLVEISDEQLRDLRRYNQALVEDNEDGQVFEFWSVCGLLDASDEILAAAEKAGWTPPADEDEEGEEDDSEDPRD